jgi:hypothetical protein
MIKVAVSHTSAPQGRNGGLEEHRHEERVVVLGLRVEHRHQLAPHIEVVHITT